MSLSRDDKQDLQDLEAALEDAFYIFQGLATRHGRGLEGLANSKAAVDVLFLGMMAKDIHEAYTICATIRKAFAAYERNAEQNAKRPQ